MDIIEELANKHNGKYSEAQNKNVSTPIGRYIFQPKKGIIFVDGTKISINLNEVSGAMPVTEPYRIILHLNKNYETELIIYPKSLWNKLVDFLFLKRNKFIPKSIRKQFYFGGNKTLLKKIGNDKLVMENLINERIYIKTGGKPINKIVLTPEYGIDTIDQFEKYISILKCIEFEIKIVCSGT